MNKSFSWHQVHVEGDKYVLYLYNKKGLRRKEFWSKDLDRVVKFMERRNKLKDDIGKALAEAIEKLKSDPSALERLKKFHDERR